MQTRQLSEPAVALVLGVKHMLMEIPWITLRAHYRPTASNTSLYTQHHYPSPLLRYQRCF